MRGPFGTQEDQDEAVAFLVATALMLAVAGCSSSPSAGDTPSPMEPTSSATSEQSNAAAPSSATPDANCLDWALSSWFGSSASVKRGPIGTGEGGDVTVTFDNGSYVLRGAGKDPIKLTLAGQTADLLVDGTISGDYRVEGNKATFTVGESTGSATLSIGSSKESVSIDRDRQRARSRRRGRIGLRAMMR